MQVCEIDGQATIGWNGDQAAQLLRGRSGSSVIVRLARRTLAVPGVPARPEPPLPSKTEYRQVLAVVLLNCHKPQLLYVLLVLVCTDQCSVENPHVPMHCICCCSDIWTRLVLWECAGAAAAREAGTEPGVQHSHAAWGPYDRLHPPDQLQPKGCSRDATCHCRPAGTPLTCACLCARRNNFLSVCKCVSKELSTLMQAPLQCHLQTPSSTSCCVLQHKQSLVTGLINQILCSGL